MSVQQLVVNCRLHRGGASSKKDRACSIGSLVAFKPAGQVQLAFGLVARITHSSGGYKLKCVTAYTLAQFKRAYRAKKGYSCVFSAAYTKAVEGLPAPQELILTDELVYLLARDVAELGLVLDIGLYRRNAAFHGHPHVFYSHMELDDDFDATFLDKDEVPIRAMGQLSMDLAPVPSTEVTVRHVRMLMLSG
jgi:hypothetical protein